MSDCLVVPLAGYGRKFKKVGYKTLKGQLGSQGLNVPRGYDPEGSESSQF